MDQVFHLPHLVAAIVYSFLGVIVLSISFVVFDLLTPGKLREQIVKENNTGLAITVGAIIIAMGMIIASAIHG